MPVLAPVQLHFTTQPKMPEHIHYLGYFAGSLTVLSFLPQVIRTWRTRQTRDLSLGMFALLVTASTLWILYGAIIGSWPVIVTNIGMVVLNGALATAKLRYS
jgi:MtN3 and saliva related transmembrane protein